MSDKKKKSDEGGDLIFCRYFIHWRTGKRVYRKDGGLFCFKRKKK